MNLAKLIGAMGALAAILVVGFASAQIASSGGALMNWALIGLVVFVVMFALGIMTTKEDSLREK